jgi:hypothetical protein
MQRQQRDAAGRLPADRRHHVLAHPAPARSDVFSRFMDRREGVTVRAGRRRGGAEGADCVRCQLCPPAARRAPGPPRA